MGIHLYPAAKVFDYALRPQHQPSAPALVRPQLSSAAASATASGAHLAAQPPPHQVAKQSTALPGFVSRLVALPPVLQLVAATTGVQKSLGHTIITAEGNRYTGRELLADTLMRDTLANGAAVLSTLNIDTATADKRAAVRQGFELLPTSTEWPLFFAGMASVLGPGKGRRLFSHAPSNITQHLSELRARIPKQQQHVAALKQAYNDALAKADEFLRNTQNIQRVKTDARRQTGAGTPAQASPQIDALKEEHRRFLTSRGQFDTAMREADHRYHEFAAAQRKLQELIKKTR